MVPGESEIAPDDEASRRVLEDATSGRFTLPMVKGTYPLWKDTVTLGSSGATEKDGALSPHSSAPAVDDNSCLEGTIIGGLGGGALGGTLATPENWIWSIPTGIIGGAMVGCQIDGG